MNLYQSTMQIHQERLNQFIKHYNLKGIHKYNTFELLNNKNNLNQNLINYNKENDFLKSKDDLEIINTINEDKKFLSKLTNDKKLNYLKSKNVILEFTETHNYSSGVFLLDKFTVKKIVKKNHIGNFMFQNEINGLMKLYNQPHFPTLYGFDKYSIYMSYCGSKINSDNIPDDWQLQVSEIYNLLKRFKVNPDDMIDRNICVLNNIIYIIDFGLNSIYSDNLQVSISKFYNLLSKIYQTKKKIKNQNLT